MNPKQKLEKIAAEKWHDKTLKDFCEVCGKHAQQTHHFFPKSSYPQLKYNIDNSVSLCMGCHFRHHHVGDPKIHATIIINRGKRWYNSLLKISRRPIKPSFKTEEYLKKIIEKLINYVGEFEGFEYYQFKQQNHGNNRTTKQKLFKGREV